MSNIKVEVEFVFSKKLNLTKDFLDKVIVAFEKEPVDDSDIMFLKNFHKLAKIEGHEIKAIFEDEGYFGTVYEWAFSKAEDVSEAFPDLKFGFKLKITYPGDYDSTQNDYYIGFCKDGTCSLLESENYNDPLSGEWNEHKEYDFQYYHFSDLD